MSFLCSFMSLKRSFFFCIIKIINSFLMHFKEDLPMFRQTRKYAAIVAAIAVIANCTGITFKNVSPESFSAVAADTGSPNPIASAEQTRFIAAIPISVATNR